MTSLWPSIHIVTKICKPLVVYRFKCMISYHSRTLGHINIFIHPTNFVCGWLYTVFTLSIHVHVFEMMIFPNFLNDYYYILHLFPPKWEVCRVKVSDTLLQSQGQSRSKVKCWICIHSVLALLQENLTLLQTTKRRPACASTQPDQHQIYLLPGK